MAVERASCASEAAEASPPPRTQRLWTTQRVCFSGLFLMASQLLSGTRPPCRAWNRSLRLGAFSCMQLFAQKHICTSSPASAPSAGHGLASAGNFRQQRMRCFSMHLSANAWRMIGSADKHPHSTTPAFALLTSCGQAPQHRANHLSTSASPEKYLLSHLQSEHAWPRRDAVLCSGPCRGSVQWRLWTCHGRRMRLWRWSSRALLGFVNA